MGQSPITYPKTGGEPVQHTEQNWRDGRIMHDFAGDVELAANGDEAAQRRLDTRRLLALRQKVRESRRD